LKYNALQQKMHYNNDPNRSAQLLPVGGDLASWVTVEIDTGWGGDWHWVTMDFLY